MSVDIAIKAILLRVMRQLLHNMIEEWERLSADTKKGSNIHYYLTKTLEEVDNELAQG